jgi:hypothetical protein
MGYSREQLRHDCFHFRLKERMGHIGQKGFQVVLDEWHDNEDPVRFSTANASGAECRAGNVDSLIKSIPYDDLFDAHYMLMLTSNL